MESETDHGEPRRPTSLLARVQAGIGRFWAKFFSSTDRTVIVQQAPRVSVVITDLDNTLFDWLGIWYQSFSAMLDQLVLDSSIPREVLEAEFQAIFQRHKTSEYAFAIEELPSLQQRHPGEDIAKKYDAAIRAYHSARKNALCLYPGVLETLEILKDKRCLLVGYTESMAYYSNYRVRKLGLDRILDFLYSPPDHELPNGVSAVNIRKYPASHYKFRRTLERYTPKGALKPNAKVLLEIIDDVGGLPEETIYIGDNLMKDIAMAKDAEVTDVWAEYGAAQDRPEYQLLKKVTHWPKADVEREKGTTRCDTKPTYALRQSFSELLGYFKFVPFVANSEERLDRVMDAWKTCVGVQQHFNDLELRIRNYGVTLLVAILGVTAFALKENLAFTVFTLRVPVAAALLGAGVIGWLAFYFMDRFWYHKLLYGAVKHGQAIEERHRREMPEIGLTDAIGKSSPIKIGKLTIHSTAKINIFYLSIVVMLIVMTVAVWLASRHNDQPALSRAPSSLAAPPAPSTGTPTVMPQPTTTNPPPSGGRIQEPEVKPLVKRTP